MHNQMLGAKVLAWGVLIAVLGGFSAIFIFCGLSNAIGVISGVVSILMFLVYVFGRMWFISHSRAIYRDKIYVMEYDADDLHNVPAEMYVVKEVDCSLDGIGESFMVTSVDGLYDLCVYKLKYNDDMDRVIGRESESEPIPFVNPGHSVHIKANTPDVFPMYEVEFYTYDYKRVRALLFTSGQNGSFAGGIEVEAGWRSFWYQFLNG